MTVSKVKPVMRMNLQYFSEEPAPQEEEAEVTEQAVAEETVPEKEEDVATVEEPSQGENTVLSQLAAELAALRSELSSLKETKETVEEQPEVAEVVEEVTDTKEVSAEVAAYESVLETVIAEKSAAIPENIIALMPDNLTAIDKLAWIEKAALAVPKVEEVKEPVILQSIGRPTPVPSTTDIPVEKMTATQKIASYFEQKFN